MPVDFFVLTLSSLFYPSVRSVLNGAALPTLLLSFFFSLTTALLLYPIAILLNHVILKTFGAAPPLQQVRTAFVWTLPLSALGGVFGILLVLNAPDWYWNAVLPFDIVLLLLLAYLPVTVQAARLLSEALALKLRYAVLLICFNLGLQELLGAFVNWLYREAIML